MKTMNKLEKSHVSSHVNPKMRELLGKNKRRGQLKRLSILIRIGSIWKGKKLKKLKKLKAWIRNLIHRSDKRNQKIWEGSLIVMLKRSTSLRAKNTMRSSITLSEWIFLFIKNSKSHKNAKRLPWKDLNFQLQINRWLKSAKNWWTLMFFQSSKKKRRFHFYYTQNHCILCFLSWKKIESSFHLSRLNWCCWHILVRRSYFHLN